MNHKVFREYVKVVAKRYHSCTKRYDLTPAASQLTGVQVEQGDCCQHHAITIFKGRAEAPPSQGCSAESRRVFRIERSRLRHVESNWG